MKRILKSALTIAVVLLAFIYLRGLYLNNINGGDANEYTKSFTTKVVETLKSINIKSLIKRSSNLNPPEDVSPGTNPGGSNGGDNTPDLTTSLNNFNNLLNSKVKQYFSSNLPKVDGETKKVSINDLIKSGTITNNDLKYIGSSCSGNAYVTKANNNLYYYDDIKCGSYSSDSFYGNWSDWVDSLPNLSGKNYQIKTQMLYNYKYSGGMSGAKYTSWSNWADNENSVTKPSVPNKAVVIDTEKENKTQYRYRTRQATYKWYKITTATEYYNGGEYYENLPAAGYLKDYATKTYSRDSAEYLNVMSLKAAESNVEDMDITEVTKHDMAVVKHKYMYTIPEQTVVTDECEATENVTQYQCYTTVANVTGPYDSSGTYSSKSDAEKACKNQQSSYASTCEGYLYKEAVEGTQQCTETQTGGTYYFEVSFDYGSFKGKDGEKTLHNCGIRCTNMKSGAGCGSWNRYTLTNDKIKSTIKKCLENFNAYNNGNGYNKCADDKRKIVSLWDTVSNDTTNSKIQFISVGVAAEGSCTYRANGDGQTTTNCTTVGGSDAKYKYRYYKNDPEKVYDDGYYTTCPSGYTKDTSKSKTTTVCTKYKTKTTPSVTYYLKSNGSTTSKLSEASLLTEEEFNKLKNQNSSIKNYVKVGNSTTIDFTGKYVEGPCPSGSNSDNCKVQTYYKAKLYKYKWYRVNTGVREYCNNGELSATSPASGCIKEESSIRYTNWGSWSNYTDTYVDETLVRDVDTKTLVRIRYVYVTNNEDVSTGWITKEEMESFTGKKIDELYGLQKKVTYKYRTKK